VNRPHVIQCNNGEITYIYDDKLIRLAEHSASLFTARASHVEPDDDGTWTVDLSPCNGPIRQGFQLRQEALDFEREWIEENVLKQCQE
jgi:hypothetical protein